jgi:hypothetical protein
MPRPVLGSIHSPKFCLPEVKTAAHDDDHHLGGWEYVSELRPPTGLLFIPQVIYQHGGTRWSVIDRRKLIRPPGLSGSTISKAGGTGEGNREFGLMKYLYSHFEAILICRKILRHGTTATLKEVELRIYRPWKSIALGRVWSREPWV